MEKSRNTCAIWNTPAEIFPTRFDGRRILSARAGGLYEIIRSAEINIRNSINNDEKLKKIISRYIYDSQGLENPIRIDTAFIEKIRDIAPLSPFIRARRLLKFIQQRTPSLNIAGLRWDINIKSDELLLAQAASESSNQSEVEALLEFLVRKGFCHTTINQAYGTGSVWITVEGAEEILSAKTARADSKRAFVAMWFSEEMRDPYDLGILPAVSMHGFEAIRIDQKEHNNKIDDEIVAEIRNARFVIADFTCGIVESSGVKVAVARGGVYFEAGFALALGIPVIWCCREDLIGHVHFDTRQYNHITWKTPDELCDKLTKRIGALIGRYEGSE